MELTLAALDDHLLAIATTLDRFGVVLDPLHDDGLVVEHPPGGDAVFELRGLLPDDRQPSRSRLTIKERWRSRARDRLERSAYEYELLDHERGFRRAFHLHDQDWFIDRLQVVVHEHCERPISVAPCRHIDGSPVRDAFQAIDRLLAVWIDPDPPDCARLPCLD